MPSFMDKLGSAAALAKWKADQQVRVMRVQNQIHDLEKQVNAQNASLASTVMGLYSQGTLVDSSLREICAGIERLNEQVRQLNENLRQIQAEQPPSDQPAQPQAPASSPAPAPSAAPPVSFPTPMATTWPPSATAPQATVLVCPQCGQVLQGKFCPEHGLPGVPKTA
ncbi:MAG TPA: hypothetical protein VMT46_04440 [Anaerolineaceae bacterium]|nr:hypothetical protein [Anaerolineaceae bacterium]